MLRGRLQSNAPTYCKINDVLHVDIIAVTPNACKQRKLMPACACVRFRREEQPCFGYKPMWLWWHPSSLQLAHHPTFTQLCTAPMQPMGCKLIVTCCASSSRGTASRVSQGYTILVQSTMSHMCKHWCVVWAGHNILCMRHSCLPCFVGRDSPDFRSDSIGHSSPGHQGPSQASGSVSQYNASGQNGVRESQDDGQAEDLVSDVHLRAQAASQAAVVAGQEQQQKVPAHSPVLFLCQKSCHVSYKCVRAVYCPIAESYMQSRILSLCTHCAQCMLCELLSSGVNHQPYKQVPFSYNPSARRSCSLTDMLEHSRQTCLLVEGHVCTSILLFRSSCCVGRGKHTCTSHCIRMYADCVSTCDAAAANDRQWYGPHARPHA